MVQASDRTAVKGKTIDSEVERAQTLSDKIKALLTEGERKLFFAEGADRAELAKSFYGRHYLASDSRQFRDIVDAYWRAHPGQFKNASAAILGALNELLPARQAPTGKVGITLRDGDVVEMSSALVELFDTCKEADGVNLEMLKEACPKGMEAKAIIYALCHDVNLGIITAFFIPPRGELNEIRRIANMVKATAPEHQPTHEHGTLFR